MLRLTQLLKSALVSASLASAAVYAGDPILDAVNGAHRSETNRARDAHRHPVETLSFFNIAPSMTVVEVWPGAGGWYTEILAPLLRDEGQLYLADFSAESPVEYYQQSRAKLRAKLDANKAIYENVKLVELVPGSDTPIVTPGTADRVLTFRNAHNWYMRGGGEKNLTSVFKQFYTALKPGGLLGVVDHELPEERPDTDQDASGYIKRSTIISAATAAGFELVASSDINHNPKDRAEHPKGVWSLPPSLRLGEQDKAKYLEIGESNRMTLKFVKPE